MIDGMDDVAAKVFCCSFMDIGKFCPFQFTGIFGIELVEPVLGAAVTLSLAVCVIENVDQRQDNEFAVDARVIVNGEHLGCLPTGILGICPTVLAILHIAMERLVIEQRQQVAGVHGGIESLSHHFALVFSILTAGGTGLSCWSVHDDRSRASPQISTDFTDWFVVSS